MPRVAYEREPPWLPSENVWVVPPGRFTEMACELKCGLLGWCLNQSCQSVIARISEQPALSGRLSRSFCVVCMKDGECCIFCGVHRTCFLDGFHSSSAIAGR